MPVPGFLYNELRKLEPLMEKKFETAAEYNRVAKCVKRKFDALKKEAASHSARFDTKEQYSGHYLKFPFKPSTSFSECLQ